MYRGTWVSYRFTEGVPLETLKGPHSFHNGNMGITSHGSLCGFHWQRSPGQQMLEVLNSGIHVSLDIQLDGRSVSPHILCENEVCVATHVYPVHLVHGRGHGIAFIRGKAGPFLRSRAGHISFRMCPFHGGLSSNYGHAAGIKATLNESVDMDRDAVFTEAGRIRNGPRKSWQRHAQSSRG